MIAHRFKRGHRIRIALSESLWPLVWPSPQIATLTFELGSSSIALPVRPAPKSEAPFPIPVLPSTAQPFAGLMGKLPEDIAHRSPEGRLTIKRDSPESSYVVPEVGTTLIRGGSELNEITEGRSEQLRLETGNLGRIQARRLGLSNASHAMRLLRLPDAFLLKESLKLTNSGELFFEQETVSKIDRNLV